MSDEEIKAALIELTDATRRIIFIMTANGNFSRQMVNAIAEQVKKLDDLHNKLKYQ